jgi:pimeloyl-ACP methyl ester carboxylesterase
MSTAEVARDMEVMRRAVGDKKLSFLGFSYGTVLGQVYANMFPDRVRAMVIDGVVDPVGWVGSAKTSTKELDERLASGTAAYKALKELLAQCDTIGEEVCDFAAGDPMKNLAVLLQRLKKKPVTTPDGAVYTYDGVISEVLGMLYDPLLGTALIPAILGALFELSAPPASLSVSARAQAHQVLATHRSRTAAAGRPDRGFPYDNSIDAFIGVMCTDGLHPKNAAQWPAFGAKADGRSPYFGRPWAWNSVWCAGTSWTVRDEDAYRGPFTRRTSAPVLVVGNHWDPATSYAGAVAASRLLPNSRLLSSDNWGHTAYGAAPCVTSKVDTYLLTVAVPANGTVCTGMSQVFKPAEEESASIMSHREPLTATAEELAAEGLPAAGDAKKLPPVVGPPPGLPIG